MITQLLDISRFAQSSGNSQGVSYHVIDDRDTLRSITAAFFDWLEAAMKIPPYAGSPYETSFSAHVANYRQNGVDVVLRDAPCLVISTAAKSSLPTGRDSSLFLFQEPKNIKMLHEVDKGFIVTDKCLHCSVCAKVCPCKNIAMVNGKPSFKHHCNFCLSCVSYCPAKAINYEVTTELKEKYPHFKYKLPDDQRNRYHNPYISVADISADRSHIK